jgi:uncharacterized Zn finger protein (UPF0148 family)
MFFCKKCGTKIENDNAKFCPNCGQKFENLQNKEEVRPTKETKIETVAEIIKQPETQNDEPSVTINNKLSKIKPSKNEKDKEKVLIIVFIILAVLIIGATGAIIYIHKTTGKFNINEIKKEMLSSLHIKKSASEQDKTNASTAAQIKTKTSDKTKNNKKSVDKIKPVVTYSSNSTPKYTHKSKHSKTTTSFSSFRYSMSNARAYVTGSTHNRSYRYNNSPGVIITNVIVYGVNAYQGSNINLRSKFYVQVPTSFSPQNVKLSYRILGNGLKAYNTSYINIKYAGAYNVAINIPVGLPAGTYNYSLTVTSPATIEESGVGYIKVE